MADASDSKSDEGDFVRVQVPPSAFLGRGVPLIRDVWTGMVIPVFFCFIKLFYNVGMF